MDEGDAVVGGREGQFLQKRYAEVVWSVPVCLSISKQTNKQEKKRESERERERDKRIYMYIYKIDTTKFVWLQANDMSSPSLEVTTIGSL